MGLNESCLGYFEWIIDQTHGCNRFRFAITLNKWYKYDRIGFCMTQYITPKNNTKK